MGKSKNFTAAEKHFQKKELEFKRRLKVYKGIELENSNLKKEIIELRKEKAELQEMLDGMLKLKDMSIEDIKTKIETEKSILRMQGILTGSGISRYFG